MDPLRGHHCEEAASLGQASVYVRHGESSLGGFLAQDAKHDEERYCYSGHSESPWIWIGDNYYTSSAVTAIPGWGTGATASAACVGRSRAAGNPGAAITAAVYASPAVCRATTSAATSVVRKDATDTAFKANAATATTVCPSAAASNCTAAAAASGSGCVGAAVAAWAACAGSRRRATAATRATVAASGGPLAASTTPEGG